ncbi:MAG: hypothetical protein BWY59_00974 [Verrucomicrobia bacterium ADurb.Bin345]|nr:MAG: hypothetical protein BWY59_00974 [Verrucomicrobia bacterium ADurb.Bin345]
MYCEPLPRAMPVRNTTVPPAAKFVLPSTLT